MAAAHSRALTAYLLLTLASAFWAFNAVIARALHEDISAVALSFWRWAIPVAVALPLVARELPGALPAIRRGWRFVVLLGLIGTALHSAVMYWALQYTIAIHVQLFNSIVPMGVMLFVWLAYGSRPTRAESLGLVVSVAGVVLIIGQGEVTRILALDFNKGDVVAVAAMVVWAVFTALISKRPPEISVWLLTFVTGVVGLAALTPLYLWELATTSFSIGYPPAVWAGACYMGIIGTLVANSFLSIGIDRIGPSRASLFTHLVPVFGALFAMTFLGEQLRWFHVAGFALVLAGLAICNRTRMRAG